MNDQQIAKQGRTAALIIAGTMLFWLIMQWAGPAIGLPGHYAFLIDLAVMAAMIYALFLTVQIWRARARADKG